MAQPPDNTPVSSVVDQAMETASPMILITLSYVEGALVEHGYAIEQHPRERLAREDAWTLSVLSADGLPSNVGIWLDERAEPADAPVHVNPAVRMVNAHDQTLFELRYIGDTDAPIWIDARDVPGLLHALTAFRHNLPERVDQALNRLHHNR